MTNQSLTFQDVVQAADRIAPYINRTPLEEVVPGLFLKQEQRQVTRSFKPRGACNALLHLSDAERSQGVIARSSGNFAQALSYLGKVLEVAVTIVMPEHAPAVKVENTRSHGARVLLKGHQHGEAQALVDEMAESERLLKMHPFDHPDVIAGQGTAALEVTESLSQLDCFFCPISGGGLLAGSCLAIKERFPEAKIIGVEPEGAADYAESRRLGKAVSLTHADSIADGLMAPAVGRYCRPILDACVDEVCVVSDEDILSAMAFLHENGVMAEPSGAASVAAYFKWKAEHREIPGVSVAMISGGNYDAV